MPNTFATSLKLPKDLKRRLERLARHEGCSPHALMVAAVTSYAEDAERRSAFVKDALLAEERAGIRGTAFFLNEVADALIDRAGGAKAKRPRARPWPR